jgi:hypothetical protein
LRDRRFSLTAGQSFSTGAWFMLSGSDAESRLSTFAPQLNTYTTRRILMGLEVTYEGQEQVAVPSGVFTACKFKEVVTGLILPPFKTSESWLKGRSGTRWIAKETGETVKWDPGFAPGTQSLVASTSR